jgi:antitoxin (DNA-binding transcriptional repressor) of toxin-antitoxin stability system
MRRVHDAQPRKRPGALVAGRPFGGIIATVGRQLGVVGYDVWMGTDETELSVSKARDHFSDAVNRAAFGGEITYITRGRGHHRAAAIVPADLVERYEELIDREDGRIGAARLADLDAGRETALTADEVSRSLER